MLAIEPVSNTVVVGPAAELSVSSLTGVRASWCGEPACVGDEVSVQVRAHGSAVPGRVSALSPEMVGELGEPLRGVAPGQTVALYAGTRVLGSATISAAA